MLISILAACKNNRKEIPSLKETYSKNDKKPFGGYIAYKQIETMFNETPLEQDQSFDETWRTYNTTDALYICLSPNLFLNQDEVNAMLKYVNAGNDLFIAAGHIDTLLLNKIGCKQADNRIWEKLGGFNSMKNTFSTLKNTSSHFYYYYYPYLNYFYEIGNPHIKTLGLNEEGLPNFIVYFYGKGKLFLHCDPRTFSNYFLLTTNNYNYLKNALAYTSANPDYVYWDNYYHTLSDRKKDDEQFSSLSEIMKHPPLAYAFWIALLLLLLYILFGGKRKQRIIKQIKPNENTTVMFTETIGRLYLQKKDNKNIADKMITYFNEHIRNTYFLNTNLINENFITTLSRKSGVPKEKIESLYRTINYVNNNNSLDNYGLLSLNEQIQYFYKNKK